MKRPRKRKVRKSEIKVDQTLSRTKIQSEDGNYLLKDIKQILLEIEITFDMH